VSLLSGEALFTLPLFAAVLTLCDEVALVSMGLAALPWLVFARRGGRGLARRRALVVAGLAAVLCPFVFGGAFSWTAAREPLHVSSGVPGFYDSVFAPGSWAGVQRLASLFTSPLLALGLAAWLSRREEPEARHALVFFATLTLLGGAVVGTLHLGAEGTESVRFVGLPQLLAPVVALLALTRLPAGRRATQGLVGAAAILTLALPSVSTLRWAVGSAPASCRSPRAGASTAFYALDCRRAGDARAFEPAPTPTGPAPTVADVEETFLAYAGCHPVQAIAAPGPRLHEIATADPAVGREGLTGWEPLLGTDEALTLVCPAMAPRPSAFCRLQDLGTLPCVTRGPWRACAADPSARRQLAARLQVSRPMPRGTPAPTRTPPSP